jgi:hypothetical protein
MNFNLSSGKLNHRKPAVYRIQVEGELNQKWSDRLGGMTISVEHNENEQAITTLQGPLPDQAALAGVLNTLYELHLPVITVEYIVEKEK